MNLFFHINMICLVLFFSSNIYAQNQTVDIVLATILLLGSVVGVQVGSRFTNILKGEYLRLILSSIIVLVSFKLLIDLITIPSDLFSVIISR